jgi:Flp pilus assembly protein TadG
MLWRKDFFTDLSRRRTIGLWRSQRRRSQLGASLVEYAFIMIIFLTLLFGIGGFGHALFVYHFLNEAAKEATRYAAVRGSTCSNDSSCVTSNSASGITGPTTIADVRSYVQSITPQSIDPSKLTVTVCGVSDTSTSVSDSGGICTASPTICSAAVSGVGPFVRGYPGCTVGVKVSYPYTFIFPFIPNPSITMASTSQMVIAH